MKRKRRVHTGEVFKHKSRLTLGGHKERPVVDYDKTYSPIMAWSTIRLFLIFFLLKGWKTRQLDFVLAYPQADVPKETYMETHTRTMSYASSATSMVVTQVNISGICTSPNIYKVWVSSNPKLTHVYFTLVNAS